MDSLMKSLLFLPLLLANCAQPDYAASRLLAESGADSSIFMAISESNNDEFSILFSSPKANQEVFFCTKGTASDCVIGSDQALKTSKITDLKDFDPEQSAFKSQNKIKLETNQVIYAFAVLDGKIVARSGVKLALNSDKDSNSDAPDLKFSNGTGGVKGLNEVSFTDSQNQTSTYKINAPEDVGKNKPYGLHVHFHGDGGGGYTDFPNQKLTHGLIGVTVRAPMDRPSAMLKWGRRLGRNHAKYADELIQNELLKKYNIDKTKIYFSGVSGGAYFVTGSFVPEFGHKYNSGAFIMCGGERPRVTFTDPTVLTNFKMYWQVTAGERQDILQDVQASMSSYKTQLDAQLASSPIDGFDPKSVQDSEITGNKGHCEFDGLNYTQGIQSMMDRKFEVVIKD